MDEAEFRTPVGPYEEATCRTQQQPLPHRDLQALIGCVLRKVQVSVAHVTYEEGARKRYDRLERLPRPYPQLMIPQRVGLGSRRVQVTSSPLYV